MPDHLSLTDPGVTGWPLHDQGEPMVDVRDVPALRVGPPLMPGDSAYARLRSAVVDRLVIAQSLLPRGLRLLLIEGYRPPARQHQHLLTYQAELRHGHPQWTEKRVRAEAAWYCAPAEVAPHPTGAAVDLTLCTLGGDQLDLGTQVHCGPVRCGGACATAAPGISAEAATNRSALGDALWAAGLVNLPTAWWHWSYGDRYWSQRTGGRLAPYGPVEPGFAG